MTQERGGKGDFQHLLAWQKPAQSFGWENSIFPMPAITRVGIAQEY